MPPRPMRTCDECGDKHPCKAKTKKGDPDDEETPDPKVKPKPAAPKSKTGSMLRDLLGF